MSSFIVNDNTINSIVTYLYRQQKRAYPYNTRGKLEAVNPGFVHPEYLGEEMYRLNLAAVEDRYGEEYTAETLRVFSGTDYRYQPVYALPVQIFKNIQCWLYQCNEGECSETPLYKILDKYAGDLARDIVSELPEYETANWGSVD